MQRNFFKQSLMLLTFGDVQNEVLFFKTSRVQNFEDLQFEYSFKSVVQLAISALLLCLLPDSLLENCRTWPTSFALLSATDLLLSNICSCQLSTGITLSRLSVRKRIHKSIISLISFIGSKKSRKVKAKIPRVGSPTSVILYDIKCSLHFFHA